MAKRHKWDVKDGKLLKTTPQIEAVTQEVPVKHLDRRIKRLEGELARVQAQSQELLEELKELKDLRKKLDE